MFRRSKEHDCIPKLTITNDHLPTAFKLSCLLQLGPVSVERCGVCNPHIGVHFIFDFRSLTILKILPCQAQGKSSIEFHRTSTQTLQFGLPARQ